MICMKTLVAYYSRSGNTRFVAQKIAEGLNADLCEIVDKKNRNGKWGFLTGGYSAFREKQTEIEVKKSVDAYDLVIVGSPVWAGKITPAIRTFLVRENLSDKQRIIVRLIQKNPSITKKQMQEQGHLSKKSVEYNVKKLKEIGLIRHVGPAKGGHWEIRE